MIQDTKQKHAKDTNSGTEGEDPPKLDAAMAGATEISHDAEWMRRLAVFVEMTLQCVASLCVSVCVCVVGKSHFYPASKDRGDDAKQLCRCMAVVAVVRG